MQSDSPNPQTKIAESALASQLDSLRKAFLLKSTTLKIPTANPKIYHLDSAKINSQGGVFKNGKLLKESLNSVNIDLHAQELFDYINNLNIFTLRNNSDCKAFIKKIFFKYFSFEARQNRRILADSANVKIIFFCSYFSNMYHFVFESYARLLILLNHINSQNLYIIAPPKYRGFKKYHDWFIKEVLDFFPSERILYLDYQNYDVKNLYFCSNPQLNQKHIKSAINDLQNRFYMTDFTGFERIYISRKKSPKRFLVNDDEIAEILEIQFGFKRIFMEDYNLKEKINLMMRAKIIITIEGTSAINGLFMSAPNAKLITLRSYDMTEHILLIAANFKHISFLPIVCESVAEENTKTQNETWVSGNLYLPKEYLLKKLQEYEVCPL